MSQQLRRALVVVFASLPFASVAVTFAGPREATIQADASIEVAKIIAAAIVSAGALIAVAVYLGLRVRRQGDK